MTAKPGRPTALGLLVPARHTREHMEEFAPMVAYAPRKGKPMITAITGTDPLPVALKATLAAMRSELGPADWIAVTSDAYVKRVASREDIPTESLETAFEAGDPEVIEQMIVALVDRYSGIEVATQAYRYIPSEGWEWDEPVLTENYDSAVVRVIKHYM